MPPTWTEPAPKPSRRPGLFRRTLRNRWLGIVAVWSLGAAVLSLAAHVYLPPSYKAYAILRCTPATNDFFGAKSTEEPFDVYMQTRVSLITSPNVLTAAASQSRVASLKRIATAKDVVQELRKVIHVSVIPATYLIEVSMKSPDPYEATVVVNAVVDSFLATNVKWDDGMTATQIKTLENYLKKLEAQTEELERKWKQLVERGDTDGRFEKTAKPEELGINRAGITLQKYKRVRAELFEVDMELAQAQAWLASARAAAAKAPIPGADQERLKQQEITRRFQADTEVRELALKLKAAQDKLDDARRVVDKPDDPAELAAVRKLAGLKKQYNELWAAKSRVFREEIEQGMGQDGALTPRSGGSRRRNQGQDPPGQADRAEDGLRFARGRRYARDHLGGDPALDRQASEPQGHARTRQPPA